MYGDSIDLTIPGAGRITYRQTLNETGNGRVRMATTRPDFEREEAARMHLNTERLNRGLHLDREPRRKGRRRVTA